MRSNFEEKDKEHDMLINKYQTLLTRSKKDARSIDAYKQRQQKQDRTIQDLAEEVELLK
jgi:hypothetical protein